MSDHALFGFQVFKRADPKTRRPFMIQTPRSPFDFFFGFIVRVVIGIVAVVVPVVPLLLWGALNGWQITTPMLAIYGIFVCSAVAIGEHLRSRLFERIFNTSAKPRYVEVNRSLIYDALAKLPAQVAPNLKGAILLRRGIDVFVSLLCLTSLWAIILIIALCIKIERRNGSILVAQSRMDAFGNTSRMLKFRTFDLDGKLTKIGAFLRRLSLDELPLFFTILGGSLTLFGPRPKLKPTDEIVDLKELAATYGIKPGLIDPITQTSHSSGGYIAAHLKYAVSRTLLTDIRLLIRVALTFSKI